MVLIVIGVGGLVLLGVLLMIGYVVGIYELWEIFVMGDVLCNSEYYLVILILFLLGVFIKLA